VILFCSFLATGVLLLVLETTVLHALPSWAGRPDPLFLLIVFLALRLDVIRGALLAFFFGLLTDIVSGLYLGLHPVAFLLVFSLAAAWGRFIPLDERFHRVPLAVTLYLVFLTALFYISIMIGQGNPGAWHPYRLAIQTGLTALLAWPLFRIFDGLHTLLCLTPSRLKWGGGRRRDNRFRS